MSQKKYLLLDNIRSLQNIGSLFRSVDGAGYTGIFLTGYTATPPRKEISKTALGAEKSVWWEYYQDPLEILQELKKLGFQLYALEQTQLSQNIFDIKKQKTGENKPCDFCFVVGNEVKGVQKKILDMCDSHFELPMHGIKKSLNVSVAGGIALYILRE